MVASEVARKYPGGYADAGAEYGGQEVGSSFFVLR